MNWDDTFINDSAILNSSAFSCESLEDLSGTRLTKDLSCVKTKEVGLRGGDKLWLHDQYFHLPCHGVILNQNGTWRCSVCGTDELSDTIKLLEKSL